MLVFYKASNASMNKLQKFKQRFLIIFPKFRKCTFIGELTAADLKS